jgi:hypothetical protein
MIQQISNTSPQSVILYDDIDTHKSFLEEMLETVSRYNSSRFQTPDGKMFIAELAMRTETKKTVLKTEFVAGRAFKWVDEKKTEICFEFHFKEII